MADNNGPRQKRQRRWFGDTAGEDRFKNNELDTMESEIIGTYTENVGHPVKTLLKMYKGHYLTIAFGFLFEFLKNVPVLVLPVITAKIINTVANPPEDMLKKLAVYVSVMLVCLLLNVPNTVAQYRINSVVSRKIEASLRGAMIKKLSVLTIPFHKKTQSGKIHSKIINDVNTAFALSTQLFTTLPSVLINLTVSLVVVLRSNRTVFLFFLLTVPCSVALVRFFRKPISKENRDLRQKMESTSSDVADMVEMTEITRAHALEEREVTKLTAILNRLATTGFRLDMVTSLFGSVSWVIFQLFQFLCLIFSAWLAFRQKIEIGDIAMYQSYFSMLTGQVSTVIGLLPVITKGFEAITSLGEILASDKYEQNGDRPEIGALQGQYEFKEIYFAYREGYPILNGFNLSVAPGETVAFVGESGAGKTTVLNLILGFHTPNLGSVSVDGHDLSQTDLRSYRANLAYVPQNTVLFTGTIRENITYGVPDCSPERLDAVLKAACLEEFIASLPNGVDTVLEEHGANLSGGQRQRLSIARALIRNPKVIILDEATSALDSVSEKMIQNAITNMAKGRTTFIVAHRLSTVKNADKIAVIQNGECAEVGTFDELMAKKGAFYRLCSYQQI